MEDDVFTELTEPTEIPLTVRHPDSSQQHINTTSRGHNPSPDMNQLRPCKCMLSTSAGHHEDNCRHRLHSGGSDTPSVKAADRSSVSSWGDDNSWSSSCRTVVRGGGNLSHNSLGSCQSGGANNSHNSVGSCHSVGSNNDSPLKRPVGKGRPSICSSGGSPLAVSPRRRKRSSVASSLQSSGDRQTSSEEANLSSGDAGAAGNCSTATIFQTDQLESTANVVEGVGFCRHHATTAGLKSEVRVSEQGHHPPAPPRRVNTTGGSFSRPEPGSKSKEGERGRRHRPMLVRNEICLLVVFVFKGYQRYSKDYISQFHNIFSIRLCCSC